MSSNATYVSRAPRQVSEGVSKIPLKINTKKSKCSKSSGSVSKSVYCSSCDDGGTSEQDTEKKRTSTSDASSTNVIFFKNITDSSANSVDDRRVPLRPGKRRSICSKIGIDRKKVKVFKGIEGMEESLENFCEFHKQLRLKSPEKQQTKKRHTSPDFIKYQRSYQKEERLVRIKKPSTAGVVNDIPEEKYPDSIFKVFMKPEQRFVKKRIVAVNNEEHLGSVGAQKRPLRMTSKTIFEATPLEKKKSPIAFAKIADKPLEKFLGSENLPATIYDKEEVGDCRAKTDYSSLVEKTSEKVEAFSERKSKSTLKSNDSVKPTLSKRSVHWEDDLVDSKRSKNSSEETQDTTETLESKNDKKSNQIRKAYQKIKESIDNRNARIRHSTQGMSRKETAKEQYDFTKKHFQKFGRPCSEEMSSSAHFETKCQEVIVAQYHDTEKDSYKFPLISKYRKNENQSNEVVEKLRNPKYNMLNRHSSSESEIHRSMGRRHYSESSEDADFEEFSYEAKSFTQSRRRKSSPFRRHSDTEASYSSLEEDYKSFETTSRRSRARTNRTTDDDSRIHRRTSSPAILKTKDSVGMLVRGKSSPDAVLMDRKSKQQQSKSTLSSSSMMTESSAKNSNESYGRGERNHPETVRCHYEAISNTTAQLRSVETRANTCPTGKDRIGSTRLNLENSSVTKAKKAGIEGEQNAFLCFKECLKQTEECLEKLKPLLAPEPRDTTKMIQKIRAKLSKIRREVDDAQSDSQDTKGQNKIPSPQNKSYPLKPESKKSENNIPNPIRKQTNRFPEKPGTPVVDDNKNTRSILNVKKSPTKAQSPPTQTLSSVPKQTVLKPHSANEARKKVPQSERSKRILEAWESTDKAIGERSERLLQTMRSMREKKLLLSQGSECSTEGRPEDSFSNDNIISSALEKQDNMHSSNDIIKELDMCSDSHKNNNSRNSVVETEVKNMNLSDRGNSQPNMNRTSSKCSSQRSVDSNQNKKTRSNEKLILNNDERKSKTEVTNENHSRERLPCLKVSSASLNKGDLGNEPIVVEEQDTDNDEMPKDIMGSQNYCPSNENDGMIEMKINESTVFCQNEETSKGDGAVNGQKNDESQIHYDACDKTVSNKSSRVNISRSNSNVVMRITANDQPESDCSSRSLERVTTASLDTERTDRHVESVCANAPSLTSSAKSSRPPSRYREHSQNDRRSGSSRNSYVQRPPSRKPYFERDSSDEGDSDGPNLSHVRVHSHQPRSRNSPASLRVNASNQRNEESKDPKKPPASRMYSTLKETPFGRKESIKSAIKDMNLSPKPSNKKVTLSSPPTANSSARESKSGEPTRPSTARSERNTLSMMSPGSLRILKEKTMRSREINAQKCVNSSNNKTGPTLPLNKALNQRSNLTDRLNSNQKSPTRNSDLRNGYSNSPSRPSTARTPNSGGSFKDSVLRKSPQRKTEQLKVTFKEDLAKICPEPVKKVPSFHRVPLSKRLPNYKPPWERVDLRPPESALAERALHEKRLFGSPRRPGTRSQTSSDASRPQTPMNRSTELRNSAKPNANIPCGTTTNSSSTVNTSVDPRQVRLRQRLLERGLPTKQF